MIHNCFISLGVETNLRSYYLATLRVGVSAKAIVCSIGLNLKGKLRSISKITRLDYNKKKTVFMASNFS